MSLCLYCGLATKTQTSKYCSNKCQKDKEYLEYILMWKNKEVDGSRGIATKNMSGHIKRYIFEKYSGKCCRCGWDKQNTTTGRTTLEVDHIDGNSENNSESNLLLLCPNCHSLTPNYKNLNKGNGRLWRREKYGKIV